MKLLVSRVKKMKFERILSFWYIFQFVQNCVDASFTSHSYKTIQYWSIINCISYTKSEFRTYHSLLYRGQAARSMPTNITCPEMKNGKPVVHVVNYTHASTALLFLFWISISSLFAIFWISRTMFKQKQFSQPRFLAIAVCSCDFLYAGKLKVLIS